MRNVFPRTRVNGKWLPALGVCLALAASCESARQPTSPSEITSSPPISAPAPPPAPAIPVPSENVISLRPPITTPSSDQDPLIGRYRLEIVVARSGDRCERVPEHVRHRIYTADIHPFRDYYAVKLYDATFLRDAQRVGYGCDDSRLEMGGVCHQFIMRRDGDRAVSVTMSSLDEWRGSEIWEIQDNRLIQLYGHGVGSVDAGRIVASGSGGLWYGNGLPATDFSVCSPDIAWTFTR